MLDATRHLIVQKLNSLESNVRLVVAHPNFRPQHLLLSFFLKELPSLYILCDGHRMKRARLNEYLNDALSEQVPGSRLGDIHYLVLDEWDRVVPADLEAFLLDVLPELSHGRIALVGRGMPNSLRRNAKLQGQTGFIPTDLSRMMADYNHWKGKETLLEVHALGRGRALLNGRLIEDWGGDVPRSLFFYLVDRGLVTRDDIFRTFWPELSVKEATNVFHVTKRKINTALGMDMTVHGAGFYRLAPDIELVYDVALFSEAVQKSAFVSDGEIADLAAQAIALYRGDFLSMSDAPTEWVQKRRHELIQSYSEALIALAKSAEQTGEQAKALGLHVRAFARYPHREDIAGNIIKLYRHLDMHNEALDIYERLDTELQKELNISPAPWVQDLVADIRQSEKAH